ncbi:MAG: hypothetical protein JW791_05520 [Nanoarchaeota archaeon]|nr:hypothetical protein [Nanoarchaeota archaeon]
MDYDYLSKGLDNVFPSYHFGKLSDQIRDYETYESHGSKTLNRAVIREIEPEVYEKAKKVNEILIKEGVKIREYIKECVNDFLKYFEKYKEEFNLEESLAVEVVESPVKKDFTKLSVHDCNAANKMYFLNKSSIEDAIEEFNYGLTLNINNLNIRSLIYYHEMIKEITGEELDLYDWIRDTVSHEMIHKVQYDIDNFCLIEGAADFGSFMFNGISEHAKSVIRKWRRIESEKYQDSENCRKEYERALEQLTTALVYKEEAHLIKYLAINLRFKRFFIEPQKYRTKYYNEYLIIEGLMKEKLNSEDLSKADLGDLLNLLSDVKSVKKLFESFLDNKSA